MKFNILCGENLTGKSYIYKIKKLKLNDKLNYKDLYEHRNIVDYYLKMLLEVDLVNYCVIKKDIILSIKNSNMLKNIIKIILYCINNKNKTIFIQNPEILLSPKTQSKLADMLLDLSNAYNINYIIETNSEHLIYRLCYLVHNNKIDNNDIEFNYYKFKELQKIKVDNNGRFVPKFPTGFFDVTLNDYLSIYRLKK